jgi:hypothetical protein
MTNFPDPVYNKTMLKDLNRIRLLLRSNFPKSSVVDGMELMCCPGLNLEKAETAAIGSPGYLTRFIHPSGHTFAKMALNLIEAMAPTGKVAATSGRKRKHSDSDSGDTSGGGSRAKERARAWSDPRRGGHHQPQPRHNSGHFDRHPPARGRGYGGGGGGYYQPNPSSGISADAVKAATAATGAAVECGGREGDSEI